MELYLVLILGMFTVGIKQWIISHSNASIPTHSKLPCNIVLIDGRSLFVKITYLASLHIIGEKKTQVKAAVPLGLSGA